MVGGGGGHSKPGILAEVWANHHGEKGVEIKRMLRIEERLPQGKETELIKMGTIRSRV